MLKNLKRAVCAASAIIVGAAAITGCSSKASVPQDPHEAVALAYNTTFKTLSGLDYYMSDKGYGLDEFIESYKNGAIDENINIRLKEVKGFGSYDTMISSVAPELNIEAGYDMKKPAYKFGLGAVSKPLNIDVKGLAYIDKDQAVFGLPDISKMYSMDFAAFAQNSDDFSASWEEMQDTFSSMPEYAASSNKLMESLSNHLLNDYYDAWLLCDVQKTENKETFTLADGSSSECEEYSISVTPDAVKKAAEIFFDYLKNETSIKDYIESNPSFKLQDKYSDTSSYDQFLGSLDEMKSKFESEFSMGEPVQFTVYAGENKIRKAVFEIPDNNNNTKVIIEAAALGKEYPLDATEISVKTTSLDGSDSTRDFEYAKITFSATEGDDIVYNFAADIKSPDSDDTFTFSCNSTETKSSGESTSELSVYDQKNDKLSISYKGKNIVNEKGKSYTYEIEDLTFALSTSDGTTYSASFDGKLDAAVLDTLEAPAADETLSTDEDMENALEEIKDSFSSAVDFSSALSALYAAK